MIGSFRIGLGLIPVLALGLSAQEPAAPADPQEVFLVTFGPGPEVWERFGHNALWIRDSATGRGIAYDFGRFNFEQQGFLWRFARGEMAYWMGKVDGQALIEIYRGLDRSVTLQELALSPEARATLIAGLESAFAVDSGLYRYDYYRDNCSTRVRDQIDLATGGALRAQLQATETPWTLRDHTRRALESSLLTYVPALAMLGPVTDRPITAWEESFLPALLQEHLRTARTVTPEGESVPLVRREVQLWTSSRYSVPTAVPSWPDRAMALLGLAVGLVLVGLGAAGRRGRAFRWSFLACSALWQSIVAVAALLLIWLWGFSDHVAAYGNANVLHFSLLSPILLGLTPGMMRGDPRRMRAGLLLSRTALAASVVAVMLGWLSVLSQRNADVSALVLPAHAGVMIGLELLSRSKNPSPS